MSSETKTESHRAQGEEVISSHPILRKVGLVYGHVTSNIGDVAINRGVRNLVEQVWPGCRLHVVLMNVEESPHLEAGRASLGDSGRVTYHFFRTSSERVSNYIFDPEKFVKECGLADSDAILLNAGEHLFAYHGAENAGQLFWRSLPGLSARALNIPCMILPSTFGPFEDEASSDLIRSLFSLVNSKAGREPISAELASAAFDSPLPALLDPAFFLDAPPGDLTARRSPVRSLGLIMRVEGYGLRVGSERSKKKLQEFRSQNFVGSKALQFSLGLAREFLKDSQNRITVFIQNSADESLANALCLALEPEGVADRVHKVRPVSIEDYLTLLSATDCVVASRFHACILGMVAQRPAIGVYFEEHGHKMPGLFALLGRPELCINLSALSPASAVPLAQQLLTDVAEKFTPVWQRIPALKSQTRDWLAAVRKESVSLGEFLDALKSFGAYGQSLKDAEISMLKKKHAVEAKLLSERHAEELKIKGKAAEQDRKKVAAELAQKHAAEVKLLSERHAEELKIKERAAEQDRKKVVAELAQKHAVEIQLLHKRNTEELEANKQQFEVKIASLQKKLENEHLEKTRLFQDLTHLKEQKSGMEQECQAARDLAKQIAMQREQLAQKIQNLQVGSDAELRAMEQRLERQAEAMEAKTLALENRVQTVREMISFRLGAAILEALRSPAKALRLPWTLWQLHLDAEQRGSRKKNSEELKQRGAEFHRFTQLLREQGVEAIRAPMSKLSLSPAAQAAALTAMGKEIYEQAPHSAIEAVREAERLDSKPYRAKWLAFRLYEQGALVEPASLLSQAAAASALSASELKRADEIKVLNRLWQKLPEIPVSSDKLSYQPLPQSLLYVTASALPYHTTGYTNRTHELVEALLGKGLSVKVMTRPGYPWDRQDRAGEPFSNETNVGAVPYAHRRTPSMNLPLDLYLEEATRGIVKVATEQKVACIHAASNYANALPALLAARKLGIPFHYEMRGLWDLSRASRFPGYENSERFELGMRLEKLVAQHADRVFVISAALERFIQPWGIEKGKIHLLPNCINAATMADAEKAAGAKLEKFTVGYAGSLVPYEGLDLLAEAIAGLKKDGIRVGVRIIGDGPSREGLQVLVKKLAVGDQFEFTGQLAPKESRALLAQTHTVVLPRRPDRVCEIVPPLKLVEALALGLPVIAPNLDVFREEIEDGHTGFLFHAGDTSSLQEKIKLMALDPALVRRLGETARQKTKVTRSWERHVPEIARSEIPAQPVDSSPVATPRSGADSSLQSGPVCVEVDSFPKQVLQIYQQKGSQEAIRFVKESSAAGEEGRALLKAGRFLKDAGYGETEYPFAEAAVEIAPSDPTWRNLFWAAQRSGHFERACEVILALESLYGSKPTIPQQELLQKLKTSPAYTLSVLQALVPPGAPKIRQVKDRVCYVLHNSLPYSSGGYATRAHGVASGLREAGFEVIAITRPGFPLDINPDLKFENIPFEDRIDDIPYIRTLHPLRRGISTREYILQSADVMQVKLESHRPEFVIAASNHVTALPALIAARRLGIPFFYEIRGFWEITRMSRESDFAEKATFAVQRILEAQTALHAEHVFTLTQPMREELVERGLPAEKITLLPNSCDPDRFSPRKRDTALAAELNIPERTPVIGYVGTFVGYEGLEDLAAACAILKREGVDFRLLLVGNENASGQDRGPITDQILKTASEAGYSDWLIMPGRVPHEKVESYYSLIDVAPFPRKPWPVCEMVSPMKPLEALAMEKAVVVSSVRALVEMISHEETGLVYEKGSTESLAQALQRLINDPEFRVRLGQNGREWVVRERTWKQIGGQFSEKIGQIVPKPAQPQNAGV